MNYPEDFYNKVICGDCLEVMKHIPDKSVDLVFSDPPYNLIGLDIFMDIRVYLTQFKERLLCYRRLLNENGSLIICGRPPVLCEMLLLTQEQGFVFRDWITWHKVDSITAKKDGYSTNYENFMIFSKYINRKFTHIPIQSKTENYSKERNIGSIWEHCKISSQHKEGTKHPTQKPIKFLKRFVETFTNKNDIVLDPFLGSGTTALACKQLNRNFIGIEISPDYCKIANDRLKQDFLF